MAHNEIYPSGVSHTCLGIEWNSASYTTYVTIAPTIWRWDEVNTANTGGRWSESLSPDPQGAGYWSGLSWGTGYGWRQIDSFATRTYNRTKSAQTVKLIITTDASYGTYWYGWVNYGTKSVSWTLTIDPLPSYNVTFNANSGSGAPATQKKWYNESLTLSSTKPTRTGYTFKQWNTKADGTGTAYAPGASYTGNAALSLYAIWTINTWTVAYNANGHGTAPASQTKTYGTNLTLRSGMGTVSNYVWKSWNTAANGSGTTYGSGAAYSTNGAATMYAQWYAPYTVSYNANGGTGAPAAQTKVYNQTLTLSATVPTRANHDFLGWATSATAETPTYRTGDDHSGNTTYSTNAALSLYAVWKIAHSNPSISYLNVKRCVSSQDGTPADDGEGCLVTANVAIDNTTEGYFDTVIRSVTVQVGSNTPETVTIGASDTTAQIEFVSSNTLSLTSTYAVKVTVEDSYGFSSYKTSNISIAYFTMHFKEGGHGIAIGKKSTVDNLFDVNMPSKMQDISFDGQRMLYWKEVGYGDKFAIVPYFSGADDANLLKIQSAVGAANTDPALSDKVTISGKSGNVNVAGGVGAAGTIVAGVGSANQFHVGGGASYVWMDNRNASGTMQNNLVIYPSYISTNKTVRATAVGGSYVATAKNRYAAYFANKTTGSDNWAPALGLVTKSGGVWNIGNYNDDTLEFQFVTKANQDSGTNTSKEFFLDANYAGGRLAAANWVHLGSCKFNSNASGTTQLSYNLTYYSEVMFVARCGTSNSNASNLYGGSLVLPKGALSTTTCEFLLTGGWTGSGTTGCRYASIIATTTYAKGVAAWFDNVDRASTTTLYVYAR